MVVTWGSPKRSTHEGASIDATSSCMMTNLSGEMVKRNYCFTLFFGRVCQAEGKQLNDG